MSAWNAGDLGSIPGFNPWVGKIPWRSKWQPTPVFWAGESHGQRILVGNSPQGRKESDTTEQLHFTSRYIKMLLCDINRYRLGIEGRVKL